MFDGMTNLNTTKKPVSQDWHPADIKAALEKLGYSLAKLSRLNGYSRSAAAIALHLPWPKMERLIAVTIGVPVQHIWPSRYHPTGAPKSGRGERGFGRDGRKYSRRASAGNVQHKRAA